LSPSQIAWSEALIGAGDLKSRGTTGPIEVFIV
jgi:hypothetical protein